MRNYDNVDVFADNPPIHPTFENTLVYGNNTGFLGRNVSGIVLLNMKNISNNLSFLFIEPEYEVYEYYPNIKDSVVVGSSTFGSEQGYSSNLFVEASRRHGVKFENVNVFNFENKTLV